MRPPSATGAVIDVNGASYVRWKRPKGDGVTGFPFDAPRADSWKVTLPCTKAEAEALQDDISPLAWLDFPPVLMTSEADGARPDEWRLDAYFDAEPTAEMLGLLAALVPSATGVEPAVEKVEDHDWITLSQQGLEPIQAGRFFVHTPAHRDSAPAGSIALEIDAGRAFGTGQHETTTGCLIALSRLKAKGRRFADFVDLGTGTGLLAFAALRLWPAARAAASDNDPVAIEVTRGECGDQPGEAGPGPGAARTRSSPRAWTIRGSRRARPTICHRQYPRRAVDRSGPVGGGGDRSGRTADPRRTARPPGAGGCQRPIAARG